MIETIHISNFKSILSDEVSLMPYTVIIGANGSGKSNLIKALDFLGAIPRSGLSTAVNHFGGFNGLVPKSIPVAEFRQTRVSFKYSKQLPLPSDYPSHLHRVSVDHELQLAYSKKAIVRVEAERITFNNPLTFTRLMNLDASQKDTDYSELTIPGHFTIEKGSMGGIAFSYEPPFQNSEKEYLGWLGLPGLSEEQPLGDTDFRELLELLEFSRRGRSDRAARLEKRFSSYLDPDVTSLLRFSAQADIFKKLMGSTRRYDLLLGELRTEQQVSDSRQLSTEGKNMPSVLRHMKSDPLRSKSWERIRYTLSAISPHVRSMSSDSLRTGKEFVEFIEAAKGRTVESWESSDGTLRTLAILLAIETAGDSSTVLIEEPEQNLHPWGVRILIDHIRDVIAESGIQVIIATHSQQVLERTFPHEVLVASRSALEGTQFRSLEEILPHSKVVMGEVGELWVKGLLGGVPSDG